MHLAELQNDWAVLSAAKHESALFSCSLPWSQSSLFVRHLRFLLEFKSLFQTPIINHMVKFITVTFVTQALGYNEDEIYVCVWGNVCATCSTVYAHAYITHPWVYLLLINSWLMQRKASDLSGFSCCPANPCWWTVVHSGRGYKNRALSKE